MQLNINQTQQNPTFGYFEFTEDALKHFKKNLKPKQLEEFQEIIKNERNNKRVEASIGITGNRLYGHLRTFDTACHLLTDYCKNLGSQGLFEKLFSGDLGYLKKVHKASSKMLDKYNMAKDVETVINNLMG